MYVYAARRNARRNRRGGRAGGESSGGGVAEHAPTSHVRKGGGGHAGMQLAEGGYHCLHDGWHNLLCRLRGVGRWARAHLQLTRRRTLGSCALRFAT